MDFFNKASLGRGGHLPPAFSHKANGYAQHVMQDTGVTDLFVDEVQHKQNTYNLGSASNPIIID